MKKERDEILQIEITKKHLSTLIGALEQVREGNLPNEKLKDIVEQMKARIDATIERLPEISQNLSQIKPEGLNPVEILEDGLNIYKKVFNILNLFLTESKKEHLEESLKVVKEAREKFTDLQALISRVTGI